jgi:hypothetical protein
MTKDADSSPRDLKILSTTIDDEVDDAESLSS